MKTTTLLRARSASQRLRTFLEQPRSGRVLATFARSCYVKLDGQIIALVAPDLGNGPLNIVLDTEGTMFAGIAADAPAASDPNRIYIAPNIEIVLKRLAAWNARLTPWSQGEKEAVGAHLQTLQAVLAAAPEGGLARAAVWAPQTPPAPTGLEVRASRGLRTLAEALRTRDPDRARDATGHLAGLGPGLTPSGDDVLVGALLVGAVWHFPGVEKLRDAIVSEAVGRATHISAAYLDAAARGEASEAWHGLMSALASGEAARVADAARAVVAFGETSGSDMLGGFVLTMGALLA